ncbi:DsbA family protein [Streptomyces sp. NPDC050504]|uniref:DsbA family protein n=1 Tax=Streptomyces sp. NPDC050504 TaxID=3365618 RepID=UPI00379F0EB3
MTGTIDFWFDYTCPLSLLTRRVVADAIRGTGTRMTWHPFELRPGGSVWPVFPDKVWENAVMPLAERIGVVLTGPPPVPIPPTRLAFQGLQYALDRDLADHYSDRVFAAYFVERRDIADMATLAGVARATGLDPEEFSTAAVSEDLAERHRQALRRAEGAVKVIPTLVVGSRRIEGVPSKDQIARLVAA